MTELRNKAHLTCSYTLSGAHHNHHKSEFKGFLHLETEKFLQVKGKITYHTKIWQTASGFKRLIINHCLDKASE